MSTIICTFRWRLDPGKGIDLLLEILPDLIKHSQHQWEFHIFGTGLLQAQLQQLASIHPQYIKLYWRSTRDQIKPVAQSWHYCLCPSIILESFGMTALEWCKLWLPVIGRSKWWLAQFIITECDMSQTTWSPTQQFLQALLTIDQHHDQQYINRQKQTLKIASQFSPTIRLQQVNII